MEGWHNSINSLMSCQHPKIFKFLDSLMKEQDAQELKIIQINAGDKAQKKSLKYERNDQRLLTLVDNYAQEIETDFIHYLHAIAHNIHV